MVRIKDKTYNEIRSALYRYLEANDVCDAEEISYKIADHAMNYAKRAVVAQLKRDRKDEGCNLSSMNDCDK